jgi:hypothetical protein
MRHQSQRVAAQLARRAARFAAHDGSRLGEVTAHYVARDADLQAVNGMHPREALLTLKQRRHARGQPVDFDSLVRAAPLHVQKFVNGTREDITSGRLTHADLRARRMALRAELDK